MPYNNENANQNKLYSTYLAINDLVSKSRLFIDLFTSTQPMYCNEKYKINMWSLNLTINT